MSTRRKRWRVELVTSLGQQGWAVVGPSCRFGPWPEHADQGEAKARAMLATLTSA